MLIEKRVHICKNENRQNTVEFEIKDYFQYFITIASDPSFLNATFPWKLEMWYKRV